MNWLKKIFHNHVWELIENKVVPIRIEGTNEIKLITILCFECKCGEESDQIYIHKMSIEETAKAQLIDARYTPPSGGFTLMGGIKNV